MPDAIHETWLPIPGYELLYEVSDLGRVRSLPRKGGRNRTYGGKILKPIRSGRYYAVALSRDRIEVKHRLHALVALTFIGPPPPGQVVRHGPAGSLDNRLANLSYGTHADNSADQVRDGTVANAKLNPALVLQLRQRVAAGETQAAVARSLGLTRTTVNGIVRGRSWRGISELVT